MNWKDAMSACAGLGNGWRLPTREELMAMYEQLYKQGKGNFKDTWYWSRSKGFSDFAWGVNFSNGFVSSDYLSLNGFGKSDYYQVRAVRAKP